MTPFACPGFNARQPSDNFSFRPTHKLCLVTNSLPLVGGIDEGIWRRLVAVEFGQNFQGRGDRELAHRITSEEADGVLAWLVEGCMRWQREGLTVPAASRAVTAEWRAGMDVIGGFIDERCEVRASATTKAADLHRAYSAWVQDNGELPVSQRRFGEALRTKGFERRAPRDRVGAGVTASAASMSDGAKTVRPSRVCAGRRPVRTRRHSVAMLHFARLAAASGVSQGSFSRLRVMLCS